MFNCGFYETEITPPLGASIYGYFFPRTVEGVRDKLFVKAIVVDCGENNAAVASLDIVSLPEENFYKRVIERVMKFTKRLSPQNIILSATHSHTSGPNVVKSETDALYIEMLVMQTADCIIHAEQRMEAMELFYGQGEANGIAFIRNYLMKDGTVRTNPEFKSPNIVRAYGEFDAAVPVIYFYNANAEIKGVIVNFACHHDCVHGNDVSGDYSSALSQTLKKHYGEEFVCLFLNGFCANVNNWDCMGADSAPPTEDYIKMGRMLAGTVVDAEKRAIKIEDETANIACDVVKLKRRELENGELEKALALLEQKSDDELPNIIDDPEGETFNTAVSEEMVKIYRDGSDVYDCVLHALRIGDCVIYAVPGENFSQFADRIKQASPTRKVFFAELSNTAGEFYVPPIELQGFDTVYENHPVSRRLEAKAGDIMTEAAIKLGRVIFNR